MSDQIIKQRVTILPDVEKNTQADNGEERVPFVYLCFHHLFMWRIRGGEEQPLREVSLKGE